MRIYETTFLLNPQVDDATLERQVRDIADLIGEGGGKVLHERRLGTRRLAYEIQGLSQAYYHNFVFESEPEVLPPIERHYRLNEAYLRHLTVIFDGDLENVEAETIPAAPAKPAIVPVPVTPKSDSDGPIGRRETEAPVAAVAPEVEAETAEPKAEEATETAEPKAEEATETTELKTEETTPASSDVENSEEVTTEETTTEAPASSDQGDTPSEEPDKEL